MKNKNFFENPYLLLTPGPLSTTKTVKATMLQDWCTWDDDYNKIVQEIRSELIDLAGVSNKDYTLVLMQGSGTFSVESVVGSVIPHHGKLLVMANGAYGQRIATIANYLNIPVEIYDVGDYERHDIQKLSFLLANDEKITHVAIVHCETTTGMLNEIGEIGKVVKKHNRIYIVDAMSSFGGIPIGLDYAGIDFLISSSNKCIQGVPGFGFIIAKRVELEKSKGWARSFSLDLYDQWLTMEEKNGKWRFTSPTHAVRAFKQAIAELKKEGGINARFIRYSGNQLMLVKGMKKLGFKTLLPQQFQSPVITTFHSPENPEYDFKRFYNLLKLKGFVIYPGKVTNLQCFRIGNIGEVYMEDIEKLLFAVKKSMYWYKGTDL
jgi:2-aminoethylphosphonate-pyruvate transaminase